MSTDSKEASAALKRDSRRWRIGVTITLVFGIFGAVMALLSYSYITGRSTPPAAKAPLDGPAPRPAADEPRERSTDDSKGRGKKDRD